MTIQSSRSNNFNGIALGTANSEQLIEHFKRNLADQELKWERPIPLIFH